MDSLAHETLANAVETDGVLSSEKALMQEVAQGASGAFDRLHARYAHSLRLHLSRLLPHEKDVEDILQDVWLRVFRHADAYDPQKSSPKTWMFSIARHAAADMGRKHARNREVLSIHNAPENESDTYSLGDLIESHEPPSDARITLVEEQRIVGEELAALPGDLRDVVVRFYLDGEHYLEIADRLGIPIGTVKSRLHAALLRLGNQMHKHHPEFASDPCISPAPKRAA